MAAIDMAIESAQEWTDRNKKYALERIEEMGAGTSRA